MIKHRFSGFTLIEVLIAIAITAVIATSAFAVLGQALKTQENVERSDDRLAEIQRGMNRMAMDFEQIARRRVRNAYGDVEAVLVGDKNEQESFVKFTRQGKRNPANLPRSELERVHYRLEEDKLLRDQWQVLDIASDDQVISRVLLTNIIKFEVEFFYDDDWVDSWPQADLFDPQNPSAAYQLPRAVKVLIEFADLGPLEQIYVMDLDQ